MATDSDLCFYGSNTDRVPKGAIEPRPTKVEATARDRDRGIRLGDAAVLTLDCYGTLVDREAGIISALMPWLHDVGVTAGRGEILRAFSQAERTKLTEAPGICYREMLVHVHDTLAEFFGVACDHKAAEDFAASIGKWPVHADVPGALAYLKEHYRLVILTNTDHASFARTNEALGVEFDAVYTAEDVGSYKPSARGFEYLLSKLADARIPKHQALHVAGSLRFDHVPAKRLGMSTCWIHRRHGQPNGTGVHKRGLDVHPDFHFDSLGALADAHWAEVGSA